MHGHVIHFTEDLIKLSMQLMYIISRNQLGMWYWLFRKRPGWVPTYLTLKMLLSDNKELAFPMCANYIKNPFAMKITIGFKFHSTHEQKKARGVVATMAVVLAP